jgi:hypothetical protein
LIGAVFESNKDFVCEDACWKGAKSLDSVSQVSLSDTKLSSVLFWLALERSLRAVYANVQGINGSAPDRHLSSAGKYVVSDFLAMVECWKFRNVVSWRCCGDE